MCARRWDPGELVGAVNKGQAQQHAGLVILHWMGDNCRIAMYLTSAERAHLPLGGVVATPRA